MMARSQIQQHNTDGAVTARTVAQTLAHVQSLDLVSVAQQRVVQRSHHSQHQTSVAMVHIQTYPTQAAIGSGVVTVTRIPAHASAQDPLQS